MDSQESVANEAARCIINVVGSSPSTHLGLATGSTQQGVYRFIVEAHRKGVLELGDVKFFMLDEYVGIPASHPSSFRHVLRTGFLNKVGVAPDSLEILDGNTRDLPGEAERFERALRDAGGIDLQLLGIGANCHIGFNEPGSAFGSRTRAVDLHSDTVQSNARFFESANTVPKRAISQGLGTIMEASSILLIAIGESKAPAIASMIEGPVSPNWPASVLQRHPQVRVIVDNAAASMLRINVATNSRTKD
jgi:glucosamine-6-phosphate deaminase